MLPMTDLSAWLARSAELLSGMIERDLSEPMQRAVAAVLASFVTFAASGVAASATVDYAAGAAALPAIRRALSIPYLGWQDTPSESTDLFAREDLVFTWWTSTPDSVVVARQIAGTASRSTLDETSVRWTTPERARLRTSMSSSGGPRPLSRDSS